MFGRLFTILLLMTLPVLARAGGLPPARDLQHDARESQATGRPILVFFMADSCSYCEQVRRLYLEPMYADASYRKRLIFRVVNVGDGRRMTDFRGKRTSQSDFADSEGVGLTPTIRFYDGGGKELVPQLRGYSSPDFYLAYLEQAVDSSIARLHRRNTVVGAATAISY
ncbi:MAG: thioredoxin fold domain-containing protein [Acidiferrobacteraceae bacterium]|jgi:thioredoxin-related protein